MNLEERIKKLVNLANERGYITYDEINEAFRDDLFLPEQLDEVYISLRNLDIEILDHAPNYNDCQRD